MSVYPVGTVLFFYGTFTDNVTMVGWYKCDGTDSTPNLMNKFVRGASASGSSGGSDNKLNISHSHSGISTRSAHTHGGTTGTSSPSTHSHSLHPWVFSGGGAGGPSTICWGSSFSNKTTYDSEGAHTHSGTMNSGGGHGHTSSSSGSSGTGANMPSYKKLIPIKRMA